MAKRKPVSKARAKIGAVLEEYKEGALKSGAGQRVESRKQAVAIALSEARKAGAKIPRKNPKVKGSTKGK